MRRVGSAKVHFSGFGLVLYRRMYRMSFLSKSLTEVNTPPLITSRWMRENQFLEPRIKVSAGQVVHDKQRRAENLVSVPLGVTIEQAVNLMREHNISQVPIIEADEVVGSISETRILDILVSDPMAKMKPVAEYMEKPFPVISEDASIEEIAHNMDHRTPAILVKHATGFDIITKSDLIFFLTKQKGEKTK